MVPSSTTGVVARWGRQRRVAEEPHSLAPAERDDGTTGPIPVNTVIEQCDHHLTLRRRVEALVDETEPVRLLDIGDPDRNLDSASASPDSRQALVLHGVDSGRVIAVLPVALDGCIFDLLTGVLGVVGDVVGVVCGRVLEVLGGVLRG